MKRILIIDDHAIVRKGVKDTLQDILGAASFGEAKTAEEALQLISANPWDLLILDIGLGENHRNGLDLLEQVRRQYPGLPVLVLSQYPEAEFGLRAIKRGASGYVSKETACDDLVAAIRRVLAGGKHISPVLAERLATEFQTPARLLHEKLSPRERDLLVLVAQGKTLKEIAELWSLSVKTVGTYHLRTLSKMRMKRDVELTRYAILNKLVE